MASLSTGSVNFPTIVYENSPALVVDLATKMQRFDVLPEIEVFDLSHLHGAKRLVDAGLMNERPHVQFVMGVKNAMPAQEHLLDILLTELRRVLPKATWTGAGIGVNQAVVMDWVLARGAHGVRTGLEDNVRIDKTRLAGSNAELVRRAAEAISRHGRQVATPGAGTCHARPGAVTPRHPRSIATVCLSGGLADKLDTAARVGFDGVEIFENDLLTFDGSPADIRRIAEDLGLTITIFQPFRDFEAMPDVQRVRNLDRAERKFDVMQQLGTDLVLVCSNVQASAIDDDARAAADLHAMAERAAARGLARGV